ncbi:MAG: hypothetical protein ACOC3W_12150 [Thermodesulfobacteriota bacterium]
MKTGIIVYVIGSQTRDQAFDEQAATRGLGVSADRVSYVFSGEGEESLVQAWMEMTVRGMARILCMAGELVQPSLVRLTGRELRLSGI